MNFYLVLTGRLLLACILGGTIGYERETAHRPAGFRTHILVCVGAALVMVTSDFIFKQYRGLASVDPTRLGAQVISGIGFLGAGTIIREGFSVKGLTTAASLWAVSCVGLAVGAGFYGGAIVTTVIIYITLILLKTIEDKFSKKSKYNIFYIETDNKPGHLGEISRVFENNNVEMKKIDFECGENDEQLFIKVTVRMPKDFETGRLIGDLHYIEGVKKVNKE
jgi:putative Mg2+ transporter-C (MgtC) family protein